jgi:hypothetical protein
MPTYRAIATMFTDLEVLFEADDQESAEERARELADEGKYREVPYSGDLVIEDVSLHEGQ